jgi:hypothetical protein
VSSPGVGALIGKGHQRAEEPTAKAGSRTVKVVPVAGRLDTAMLPSWLSTMALQMANPKRLRFRPRSRGEKSITGVSGFAVTETRSTLRQPFMVSEGRFQFLVGTNFQELDGSTKNKEADSKTNP